MIMSIKKYAGFFLFLFGIAGIIVVNSLKAGVVNTAEIVTTENKPSAVLTTKQQVAELAQTQTMTQTGRVFATLDTVFCDIKGEILHPGVYPLPAGSRVQDAILIAGGTTATADTEAINLSKTVFDQMVIFIPSKTKEAPASTLEIAVDLILDDIQVDIKGEVLHPGVYEISLGSRITEVIALAGGLTKNADTTSINLAEKTFDEMVITIPKKEIEPVTIPAPARKIYVEIRGEVIRPGVYYVDEDYQVKNLINDAGGLSIEADVSKIDFEMPLWMGAQIVIAKYDPTVPSANDSLPPNPVEEEAIDDGLIDINTADLETLITLKGIGIVLGQRIIDYRAEFGFFFAIEDIMFVSGIKESIYAQIKDYIKVSDW